MFTGIVEERGRVTAIEPRGEDVRLSIGASTVLDGTRMGDSIQVSGVCLTVVAQHPDGFAVDVMGQTLRVATTGALRPGDDVNLERAARVGDRLGGHIVQGHVDGVGRVLERRDHDGWRVLRIAMPRELAPLVVDKGSIAVEGVSLTVSAIGEDPAPGEAQAAGDGSASWFEVSLIPETLRATTLGALEPGAHVNLETDVLARHVQRLWRFAEREGAR